MPGNPLTKEVAEKALRKLNARDVTPKGAPHPIFAVYHGDQLVATTGLRHSSKKDILVPHAKRDLRVNAGFVLELAHCTKYLSDWLRRIGILAENDAEENPDAAGN
jgi:hypothetical protein